MKILLLSSSFFGYSQRVANAIRDRGNEVDEIYSCTIPYYMRVLRKLHINICEKFLKEHYKNEIDALKTESYDKVIVFGGGTPLFVVKRLKQQYNDTEFLLYLSADLSSYGFSDTYLALFNRILSYSLSDSEKYGFDYSPWFFSDSKFEDKEIDISFVGTIHPVRLYYLKKILSCHSFNCFYYIFAEKLSYIKYYISWHSFKRSIHFTGLSYENYVRVLSLSKATLDIPEAGQNNITTRPIEALATNTKIITTNANIMRYDFYNENNILIIDRNFSVDKIKNWLDLKYCPCEKTILNKYSIDSFVQRLLTSQV